MMIRILQLHGLKVPFHKTLTKGKMTNLIMEKLIDTTLTKLITVKICNRTKENMLQLIDAMRIQIRDCTAKMQNPCENIRQTQKLTNL